MKDSIKSVKIKKDITSDRIATIGENNYNTLEWLFSFPYHVSEKQVYNVDKIPSRIVPKFFQVDKAKNLVQQEGLKMLPKLKKAFLKVLSANYSQTNYSGETGKKSKVPYMDIAILKDNKVQLFFEWQRSDTIFSRQWVIFNGVHRDCCIDIAQDFSKHVLKFHKVSKCLMESAIPDMYFGKVQGMWDVESNKYHSRDYDEYMEIMEEFNNKHKNNIVEVLPLLFDLIVYLRDHKTGSIPYYLDKDDRIYFEAFKLDFYNQILPKDINRSGKLAFKRELSNIDNPMCVLNFHKGQRCLDIYRKGLFLDNKAIAETERKAKSLGYRFFCEYDDFLNTDKLCVALPEALFELEKRKMNEDKPDYLYIPNLRILFSRFAYLDISQRKAIYWALLQRVKEKEITRNVDKLYRLWEISPDKNHPSRVRKKISKCLLILLRTGLIVGYRFTENQSGKEQIVFYMNTEIIRPFIDVRKDEDEDEIDDEQEDYEEEDDDY